MLRAAGHRTHLSALAGWLVACQALANILSDVWWRK